MSSWHGAALQTSPTVFIAMQAQIYNYIDSHIQALDKDLVQLDAGRRAYCIYLIPSIQRRRISTDALLTWHMLF